MNFVFQYVVEAVYFYLTAISFLNDDFTETVFFILPARTTVPYNSRPE